MKTLSLPIHCVHLVEIIMLQYNLLISNCNVLRYISNVLQTGNTVSLAHMCIQTSATTDWLIRLDEISSPP